MFIWVVLIAIVTWSGFGSSRASAWRASLPGHLASVPGSGAKEIEPPTCRIIFGTAWRRRPSISSNFDSRFEPCPSSSRTWMCRICAPAL